MEPKDIMNNLYTNIPGSKYFTWSEALWLNKVSGYALPTVAQASNIINLAVCLDKVRDHFARPITVNSWLRPYYYNQLIGGALNSAHIDGLAVDFTISGIDSGKVREVLIKDKTIWPYRGELDVAWVHLDMRAGPWFRP
jgi:hypothetical protein